IFEAEHLNIPVIRRISGGGTVYHDHGNVNFTFIRNTDEGRQVDFELHTKPVIGFLNSIGISARLTGKSNITVEGLKISGNAEHVFRDRVLHHGTLLFRSSVETMKRLLRDETLTYTTGAVASNRAAVVNICDLTDRFDSPDAFSTALLEYVAGNINGLEIMNKDTGWHEAAELLAGSRYRTWEWNYGYTPPYNFRSTFPALGCHNILEMSVRDGIIWKCSITGTERLSSFAKTLIGCRHDYREIKEKLSGSDLTLPEETIKLFF
ncbi:MAG: hypothetical protein GYA43_06645, partial [Bacteroidales bacterium]|nr:hypothetical protein [Bacteroidales bacterium]